MHTHTHIATHNANGGKVKGGSVGGTCEGDQPVAVTGGENETDSAVCEYTSTLTPHGTSPQLPADTVVCRKA